MRILLVSQMYPGPDDPDLGVFVRGLELALRDRGHEVELAVLDRRAGGKARYLELLRRTRAAARPDVVYAHFLVPSGLVGALAGRAPLVVTAHGRDVRNVGSLPGVAAATRLVVRRAAAVVCVSEYLRRELETKLPAARGKTEVVSSGVDLERFAVAPAPDGPPRFLCVGSLSERKNVVRLADAFDRYGRGILTFVGEGPLRPRLAGRRGVFLLGAVPHDEIPGLVAGAHVVCQPSLLEPLGQSLLEAMACGRPVVATRVGGSPELVPPGAGVLVDPLDGDALAALEPRPQRPVADEGQRAAAEAGERVGEPDDVLPVAERADAEEARPVVRRGRDREPLDVDA
ncbi:MAG TPA: glycosyltransferase, partial [Gaiellaceae bacterium]|nr:glycosyltransferase [Gaiellaceae bacterium]